MFLLQIKRFFLILKTLIQGNIFFSNLKKKTKFLKIYSFKEINFILYIITFWLSLNYSFKELKQ
jgi:hypothetical protein